jgi:hypothetical protein
VKFSRFHSINQHITQCVIPPVSSGVLMRLTLLRPTCYLVRSVGAPSLYPCVNPSTRILSAYISGLDTFQYSGWYQPAQHPHSSILVIPLRSSCVGTLDRSKGCPFAVIPLLIVNSNIPRTCRDANFTISRVAPASSTSAQWRSHNTAKMFRRGRSC